MAVVVKRFDLFLVTLNPTIGSEIQKSRPCLIVSPDELNRHIKTVIIHLSRRKEDGIRRESHVRFKASEAILF